MADTYPPMPAVCGWIIPEHKAEVMAASTEEPCLFSTSIPSAVQRAASVTTAPWWNICKNPECEGLKACPDGNWTFRNGQLSKKSRGMICVFPVGYLGLLQDMWFCCTGSSHIPSPCHFIFSKLYFSKYSILQFKCWEDAIYCSKCYSTEMAICCCWENVLFFFFWITHLAW